MSGVSPVKGGYVRQRHNSQGYSSSGEEFDIEDDALSRVSGGSSLPLLEKAGTWSEVLVNLLWVVSAVFAVYYGDRRVNMVALLWYDGRIKRTALHLGIVSGVLNVCLIIYATYFSSSSAPKSYDKSEALASAAPLFIVLGFLSFCLFSYALWPIWSFLTIPLLFTLFMASLAVLPYLLIGPLRPQTSVLRAD